MMKRTFLATLLTLVMLLSLTACGGGAKTEEAAPMWDAPAAEAPMVETESYDASMEYGADLKCTATEDSAAGGGVVTGQKLIRNAWLEMETTTFEEAVQGLTELTEDFNGYFENSNVSNRKNGSRWADYTIRIPAEKYSAFLTQAGELCHVTRQEASQDDISEVYYDTAGRLKTQQIKLERLQELLSRAEIMEDIITIESAISETEQMIDQLSGTLRNYDGKVNYSTIYVNLQEVYKLSNVEEVPATFGERMGDSFSRGLRDFGDSMEDLAVGFAYSWMWWLGLAVVIVIVVRVARKGVKLPKLRRKKKDDKSEEN